MATQRKSAKKYWPVILFAAALAETAHAPLIDGALASDHTSSTASKAVSADQKPVEADKKLPPALEAAPVAELNPPQSLQKPALPLPPLLVGTIYPGLDAAPAQPISLLHTAPSDESTPTLGSPVDSNPVAADPPPDDTSPPAAPNPISDPVLGDPANPTNPVAGAAPDPIVAVPEPGGIFILLGGATLLGRRRLHV